MRTRLLLISSVVVLASGCGSAVSDDQDLNPSEPEVTFEKPTPFEVPEFRPSNCDPNYEGACVPLVSYDLDCPDIEGPVYVVGTDIHGFDRDRDGIGCEPYP